MARSNLRRAMDLAKAGVNKAQDIREQRADKADPAAAAERQAVSGSLPMTLKSHDKGKNATVTLHPDRIERVLERSALSMSRASQETEVIPVRQVSSVASKKDGLTYTIVSAITSGATIDFRLAHADAGRFKDALTALVLGAHVPTAPAVAGPDMAAQLRQLSELHATGALSDEEFAAAKQRLLA